MDPDLSVSDVVIQSPFTLFLMVRYVPPQGIEVMRAATRDDAEAFLKNLADQHTQTETEAQPEMPSDVVVGQFGSN